MKFYVKIADRIVSTNESAIVALATYGCVSWTLRKNEETRLDAFESKDYKKDSAGFVDSKEKQMSGFLTKLE